MRVSPHHLILAGPVGIVRWDPVGGCARLGRQCTAVSTAARSTQSLLRFRRIWWLGHIPWGKSNNITIEKVYFQNSLLIIPWKLLRKLNGRRRVFKEVLVWVRYSYYWEYKSVLFFLIKFFVNKRKANINKYTLNKDIYLMNNIVPSYQHFRLPKFSKQAKAGLINVFRVIPDEGCSLRLRITSTLALTSVSEQDE